MNACGTAGRAAGPEGAGTRFDPVGHAIVLYSVDGTERIACGVIELD
jgi:hypothetical protein